MFLIIKILELMYKKTLPLKYLKVLVVLLGGGIFCQEMEAATSA